MWELQFIHPLSPLQCHKENVARMWTYLYYSLKYKINVLSSLIKLFALDLLLGTIHMEFHITFLYKN